MPINKVTKQFFILESKYLKNLRAISFQNTFKFGILDGIF